MTGPALVVLWLIVACVLAALVGLAVGRQFRDDGEQQ